MTPTVEEMTVTLRKPIHLTDRVITEITLREPTAAEVAQSSKKDGMDGNILLVALVSELTVGEVGRMGIRDLQEATNFLLGFLPESRETKTT